MGSLYYMVVTIFNLSYVITIVSSVEICSNGTETGGQLILNKIYESGGSCGCSVKLADSDRNSNVTFQSTQNPGGCQYKLMFRLKNKTREYNCTNYFNFTTFLMTPTDHLYVNLMNDRNVTNGFTFSFNIYSDTNVNLSCRSPWTNPNLQVTTQSTTTVEEFTGTTEKQTESTGTTEKQAEFTGTTETQAEFTGTTERQTESTGTTEKQAEFTGTTEIQAEFTGTTERSETALIAGLSVGGVVLVSVVILTGIICFLRRRKQKQSPEQSVTNQNITDNNQHQNTHDIIPNNIYSSLHLPEHDLNDSERYEQLWKGHKHVPEQQEQISEPQEHALEQQENVPDQVHVPEQHDHIPHTSSEHVNNIIPQHVYSSLDNDLKDSERYEHFPKQQEQVPQTKNEYVNIPKKSLKCQNNGTGLNNKLQKNGCYENLMKNI